MKAFLIITVARQVYGEYILVRTEKAFTSATKAEAYLQEKKKEFVTMDGKPKSVLLSTTNGDVECMCEVGVFEIEIEE